MRKGKEKQVCCFFPQHKQQLVMLTDIIFSGYGELGYTNEQKSDVVILLLDSGLWTGFLDRGKTNIHSH